MRPYYVSDDVTIYHGNCLDVLPSLRDAGAAAVVTDPPYGLDGAIVRRNATDIEDWSEAMHNVIVDDCWRALAVATLKPDAYFVEFFAGAKSVEDAFSLSRACGLTPWRFYFLVKTAPPPTPRPTMMSGVEMALISFVGRRPWYGGQHPDRWIGLTPNRLGLAEHPSEKPPACMRALIGLVTPIDALVIDPFMGSGTTLVAARAEGRRAIGIEIEERWCEVAARRLAQAVLPLEMA